MPKKRRSNKRVSKENGEAISKDNSNKLIDTHSNRLQSKPFRLNNLELEEVETCSNLTSSSNYSRESKTTSCCDIERQETIETTNFQHSSLPTKCRSVEPISPQILTTESIRDTSFRYLGLDPNYNLSSHRTDEFTPAIFKQSSGSVSAPNSQEPQIVASPLAKHYSNCKLDQQISTNQAKQVPQLISGLEIDDDGENECCSIYDSSASLSLPLSLPASCSFSNNNINKEIQDRKGQQTDHADASYVAALDDRRLFIGARRQQLVDKDKDRASSNFELSFDRQEEEDPDSDLRSRSNNWILSYRQYSSSLDFRQSLERHLIEDALRQAKLYGKFSSLSARSDLLLSESNNCGSNNNLGLQADESSGDEIFETGSALESLASSSQGDCHEFDFQSSDSRFEEFGSQFHSTFKPSIRCEKCQGSFRNSTDAFFTDLLGSQADPDQKSRSEYRDWDRVCRPSSSLLTAATTAPTSDLRSSSTDFLQEPDRSNKLHFDYVANPPDFSLKGGNKDFNNNSNRNERNQERIWKSYPTFREALHEFSPASEFCSSSEVSGNFPLFGFGAKPINASSFDSPDGCSTSSLDLARASGTETQKEDKEDFAAYFSPRRSQSLQLERKPSISIEEYSDDDEVGSDNSSSGESNENYSEHQSTLSPRVQAVGLVGGCSFASSEAALFSPWPQNNKPEELDLPAGGPDRRLSLSLNSAPVSVALSSRYESSHHFASSWPESSELLHFDDSNKQQYERERERACLLNQPSAGSMKAARDIAKLSLPSLSALHLLSGQLHNKHQASQHRASRSKTRTPPARRRREISDLRQLESGRSNTERRAFIMATAGTSMAQPIGELVANCSRSAPGVVVDTTSISPFNRKSCADNIVGITSQPAVSTSQCPTTGVNSSSEPGNTAKKSTTDDFNLMSRLCLCNCATKSSDDGNEESSSNEKACGNNLTTNNDHFYLANRDASGKTANRATDSKTQQKLTKKQRQKRVQKDLKVNRDSSGEEGAERKHSSVGNLLSLFRMSSLRRSDNPLKTKRGEASLSKDEQATNKYNSTPKLDHRHSNETRLNLNPLRHRSLSGSAFSRRPQAYRSRDLHLEPENGELSRSSTSAANRSPNLSTSETDGAPFGSRPQSACSILVHRQSQGAKRCQDSRDATTCQLDARLSAVGGSSSKTELSRSRSSIDLEAKNCLTPTSIGSERVDIQAHEKMDDKRKEKKANRSFLSRSLGRLTLTTKKPVSSSNRPKSPLRVLDKSATLSKNNENLKDSSSGFSESSVRVDKLKELATFNATPIGNPDYIRNNQHLKPPAANCSTSVSPTGTHSFISSAHSSASLYEGASYSSELLDCSLDSSIIYGSSVCSAGGRGSVPGCGHEDGSASFSSNLTACDRHHKRPKPIAAKSRLIEAPEVHIDKVEFILTHDPSILSEVADERDSQNGNYKDSQGASKSLIGKNHQMYNNELSYSASLLCYDPSPSSSKSASVYSLPSSPRITPKQVNSNQTTLTASGSRSPRLRKSPIPLNSPTQSHRVEDGLEVLSNDLFEKRIGLIKVNQIDAQKKLFKAWINHYCPKLIHGDLVDELKDGVKLCCLLAHLAKDNALMAHYERVRVQDKQSTRQIDTSASIHQHLANVSLVINYLREKRHMKLVNLNLMDIVNGKPTVILGLCWNMILNLQLDQSLTSDESSRLIYDDDESELSSSSSSTTSNSITGKKRSAYRLYRQNSRTQRLLNSVEEYSSEDLSNARRSLLAQINQKFKLKLTNLTANRLDPEVLLDIIGQSLPNEMLSSILDTHHSVKWQEMTHDEKLDYCFDLAETHLQVPKLFSSNDLRHQALPEDRSKSLLVYLSMLINPGITRISSLLTQVDSAKSEESQSRPEILDSIVETERMISKRVKQADQIALIQTHPDPAEPVERHVPEQSSQQTKTKQVDSLPQPSSSGKKPNGKEKSRGGIFSLPARVRRIFKTMGGAMWKSMPINVLLLILVAGMFVVPMLHKDACCELSKTKITPSQMSFSQKPI